MGRKSISIALLIVAIAGLSLFYVFHDRKKVDEEPVFIASGHPEWAPIMWREGDNIVGAGPSLLTKIANDLKFKVNIKYTGPWDVVQTKARNGEVDMLVGAYKTQARLDYMEYSEPYAIDPIVLIVRKDRVFPYENWKDLAGKKGLAMVGDSYGQEFDNYIISDLSIKRYGTASECLDILRRGEADYFVYALYSAEKILNQKENKDEFAVVQPYLAAENFYLTISKKSPLAGLMPQINRLIAEYKQDGTIDRLIRENKKW